MKATYLGKNGYPFEREEANKYFTVGESYEVISGRMGRESSSLEFKDVQGSFNTVMFSYGKDVERMLDRAYAREYQAW